MTGDSHERPPGEMLKRRSDAAITASRVSVAQARVTQARVKADAVRPELTVGCRAQGRAEPLVEFLEADAAFGGGNPQPLGDSVPVRVRRLGRADRAAGAEDGSAPVMKRL